MPMLGEVFAQYSVRIYIYVQWW